MFRALHHRFLVAACMAVVLSGFLAESARADVSAFEITVLSLVNQDRAALGRAPLGSDVRLFNAAEGHTDWMCNNQSLSHIGAGGSTPGSRATAAGYVWNAVGETIAQGYPTPQDVVSGWRGSSPHWTILMSATYRDVGVAYVACTGRTRRHYWTAVVANSTRAATPVSTPTTGPTSTASRTATRTPTRTPTATSAGPTATILVVTATPSATRTRTATPGVSPTPSRTPTRTATRTPTRTSTASFQPTATRTRTATRPPSTATATRTPTRTTTAVPFATATPPPPATAVGPTVAPPSGGANLVGKVVLQGRSSYGGTTIYVNGAPLAITSDDGSFVVRGLVPGFKTVRAQRFGYLDAATQTSLVGGQWTVLGSAKLFSGDVHVDRRVTALDQLVVQLRYGACVGTPAYTAHIDLDGSGCIDSADLALVTLNVGRFGPTAWQ